MNVYRSRNGRHGRNDLTSPQLGKLATALGVLAVVAGGLAARAEVVFEPLGTLPPGAGRDPHSEAFGVSADGNAIVGSSFTDGRQIGCKWTPETGWVALESELSESPDAWGISGDGTTVVGAAPRPGQPGYVYNAGARWVGMGIPDNYYWWPESDDSKWGQAYDVSFDGSVVVGVAARHAGPYGYNVGFRWTAGGGMQPMGLSGVFLPDASTNCVGVSDDGTVVVGDGLVGDWNTSVRREPFRWDNGTLTALGILPPSEDGHENNYALNVSPDGSVVVGYGNSEAMNDNEEAFYWTQATGMIGLGSLPNTQSESYAYAVAGDNKTIVGMSGSSTRKAFVWYPATGMMELQKVLRDVGAGIDDWTLREVRDISNNGVIVGWGQNPDGDTEAFRVTGLDLRAGTGGNDVTIGSTTNSMDGSPDFYSTDESATLSVADLKVAMAGATAGVRTAAGGNNSQQGNLTLDAELDYDGKGTTDLTFRATNNLTVNQAIHDASPDRDSLSLSLVADNSLIALNTLPGGGDLDINARIELGDGDFFGSGVNFDNTGGPISTTGDATLDHSGVVTVGANVSAVTLIVNDAHSVDVAAGVSVVADTVNFGGVGDLTLHTGTIITARTMDMNVLGSWTLNGATVTVTGNPVVELRGSVADHGTINAKVLGLAGSMLTATGNMTLGDAASYNGFSTEGTLDVQGNTVTLHSKGFANLGSLTTLSGGTLVAPNGVALGVGDNLVGGSIVDAKVAAAFGSTIEATGSLSLGDMNSYVGFFSDGELYTNANEVTINDRNMAVLGSLTTLGGGGDGGTLTAGNAETTDAYSHFLLEQGKNLVGHGTVNGHFKNHGDAIGDGTVMDERLVFGSDWTVTGKGTFTNTLVLGTFDPGESPSVIDGTDQGFGGTVKIDLGGTTPGFGDDNHDQVNDTATIWLFNEPELSILPWNNFVPEVGDEFEIMTWQTGLDGAFGTVTVDQWFTDNGIDFDLAFSNPTGVGSLVLTAVPEPSTVLLAALGLLGLLAWVRRRKR